MAVPADDRDVVQWSNRFGSASEEDMSNILTDLEPQIEVSNFRTGYFQCSGIFSFDKYPAQGDPDR
jgi:hypothetical protein